MAVTLELPDFLEAELRVEAAEKYASLEDYLLTIIRQRRWDDNAIGLRLSLLRALVGTITPNLYAVTAGMTNNAIEINAFFYNGISEDDLNNISSIAAEVTSDYPASYSIEEACFSKLDTPVKMLDFWAFKRED